MKLLLLLLSVLLFAQSPFETKRQMDFDLSVYETKQSRSNRQASKNRKIKCRYVCDKKLYKEHKIAEAIEFYKKRKAR